MVGKPWNYKGLCRVESLLFVDRLKVERPKDKNILEEIVQTL